jgi:hypothetical protein
MPESAEHAAGPNRCDSKLDNQASMYASQALAASKLERWPRGDPRLRCSPLQRRVFHLDDFASHVIAALRADHVGWDGG